MDKQSRSMMMIASSSCSSQFRGRKKQLYLNGIQFKGKPLSGIQEDIHHFQQKFPMSKIIQTSKDKKTLLSRSYVINTIKNQFNKQHIQQFFIFYSGHGHTNGDWAIQTLQKPNADRISLEDIIALWQNKTNYSDAKLFIFSDSCYSGSWCNRLKYIPDNRIYLFASCRQDEVSFSINGGLFFNCILCPLNKLTPNYSLLKQYQNPIYLSCDNKINDMNREQLRALILSIEYANVIYGTKGRKNIIRPYTLDNSKKNNQSNEPRCNSSAKNSNTFFQPYPQFNSYNNPSKFSQYNYNNNNSKPTLKEYVYKQKQQNLSRIHQQRENRLSGQYGRKGMHLISYQMVKSKQALRRQVQLPSIPAYPRCKFN